MHLIVASSKFFLSSLSRYVLGDFGTRICIYIARQHGLMLNINIGTCYKEILVKLAFNTIECYEIWQVV